MRDECCVMCGATEKIQRHHISYEPEIIQLLCVDCHKAVHKHGVGNPKGWNTKLFEKLKNDVKALFSKGATNGGVAKTYNISYATASHWRKKLGLGFPRCVYSSEVKDEAEIEKETEAIILKRNITNRIGYLTYLKGQKEIKRAKAEAKIKDIELEITVIEKMINREEAKGLEEEETK